MNINNYMCRILIHMYILFNIFKTNIYIIVCMHVHISSSPNPRLHAQMHIHINTGNNNSI